MATQNIKYVATVTSNNSTYPWYVLNATTLHAAKIEASRSLGRGYAGDLIQLYVVPEDTPEWRYEYDYIDYYTKIIGRKGWNRIRFIIW